MNLSRSYGHRSTLWTLGLYHSQWPTVQRCEKVQQKEEAQTNMHACTHTQMLILQDLCKLVTGMAWRSQGNAKKPCVTVIFTNKTGFFFWRETQSWFTPLPAISSSITRSIYYCRLLWLASCDAVIISEYINVKPYNAFTSLILKALRIIETVSRRLLSKSLVLGLIQRQQHRGKGDYELSLLI